MAPYEALYGRKCRSPLHWEIDDQWTPKEKQKSPSIPKVDLVQEPMEKVKSRQNSYADKRRKDLEFENGDEVFLKLSPRKGLINPKKGGKLSPRYVGPYKDYVEKYVYDPNHIINLEALKVNRDMTYRKKKNNGYP
ncbi:hypothetical protein DH2020_006252 [Rehmannia glutinosa]|uniref:Uncharacterized protein n=1 Tax=Rehmannia glutinosa TaxID=99300 RepID=A0ABR0XIW8_REHGL